MKLKMPEFLKRVLASLRWNLNYVCEMSDDKTDYHDYPDSEIGVPLHMYTYTCVRCSKKFSI